MVNPMHPESQGRLLMKILIGVAWLDGKIQPEERQYLAKVAHDRHLDLEPEIEALLSGTAKVTPADCEQWIGEYLGDRSIYDDDGLIAMAMWQLQKPICWQISNPHHLQHQPPRNH
jgi:hypothetical protein